MFNSKFTIFIISILILCLVLVGCMILNNNSELNFDIDENSNDTVVIQMLDENGNVQLVPISETYAEGQASSWITY